MTHFCFFSLIPLTATVTVLPKLQIETLESLGAMMKSKAQNQSLFGSIMNVNGGSVKDVSGGGGDDDVLSIGDGNDKTTDAKNIKSSNGLFDDLLCREVAFIVLQLVNSLKTMQAKGIEDTPMNLTNIIMCRETDKDKDSQARLCILQG